jgi:hypothetical protein
LRKRMAVVHSEGGGVEVDGGGVLQGRPRRWRTDDLRKTMAMVHSEAGVEAAACFGVGDEAAVSFGARDEDDRWRR